MAKIKPLRECALFKDLPDRELAIFSKIVEEKPLPAGATLFTEGLRSESMYLIAAGSVKVSKLVSEGEEQVLAVLGAGDFFGEMALLAPGSRAGTAVTTEPTTLLIIKRADFKKLEGEAPQVCLAVLWSLADHFGRQLRDHGERYKELLFGNAGSPHLV